jgi:hypothetical protein
MTRKVTRQHKAKKGKKKRGREKKQKRLIEADPEPVGVEEAGNETKRR